MARKRTRLERLQAEYDQARRRYRAVAPLGGRKAAYWLGRFGRAAAALEEAQQGQEARKR